MHYNKTIICEEFPGFATLKEMNTYAIADAILKKCRKFGLDMNKLLRQGYDGCSAMAGYIDGVQTNIIKLHTKAAFVHWSSHRLNLVINDVNSQRNMQHHWYDQGNDRHKLKTSVGALSGDPWFRMFLYCFRKRVGLLSTRAFEYSVNTLKIFSGSWNLLRHTLPEILSARPISSQIRNQAIYL